MVHPSPRTLSAVVAVLAVAAGGCSGAGRASAPAPEASSAPPPPPAEAPARPASLRSLPDPPEGRSAWHGFGYGPFREGQAPGGPDPTLEQMREDMRILDPHADWIRVYSSRGPTEDLLRVIRDDGVGIQVVLGVWIGPDDPEANATEVREGIRLANAYPDQVMAVSVGNESQVSWSAHRTDPAILLEALDQVRAGVQQPITTADDYSWWVTPESDAVAARVDFLMVHAYALWNGKQLDEAVAWTDATLDTVQAAHPDHPIVLAETGWATARNPEGNEMKHQKAPVGLEEQARFYRELTAWTAREAVPLFYFEAFDEPWKGSDDPREVEKHWGLWGVDRQLKTPDLLKEPT